MSTPKATLFLSTVLAAFVLVLALVITALWLGSGGRDEGSQPRPASARAEIPPATGTERIVVAIAGPRPPETYLHTFVVDGSGHRRVTTSAGSDAVVANDSPAWSPDGRRVAFIRTEYAPGGRGSPSHVYVEGLAGGRPRRVTKGRAAEMAPAWAPDGARLALARELRNGFGLVVARVGRPRLRVLVRPTRTMTDATSPAWSPDGRSIAFTAYVRDNEDIYVVNVDGTGLRPLLEGPTQDSYPVWSPDRRRLAFTRDADIYTMNVDGTDVRPVSVAPEEDTAPRWSADGTHIVFTRADGSILIVRPDGTGLARVPLEFPAFGAGWAGP